MTVPPTTLIAQISDPHIKVPGRRAYGRVDTAAALAASVEAVNALTPLPDLVVISGDLVDGGAPAEYAHLVDLLAPLRPPVRVVPGNHDARGPLTAALAGRCGLTAGEGPVTWVHDLPAARVIGLDSTVPGAAHGQLGAAALAGLDAALAERPDAPAMVVLHHPPIRVGIPGMDADNLRDGDALARVLAPHGSRCAIVCGHVHRAVSAVFAGALLTIAPGVSHAVLRSAEPPVRFALEPPGYVLHSLDGGVWTAQFCPIGTFAGPFPFRHADGRFID